MLDQSDLLGLRVVTNAVLIFPLLPKAFRLDRTDVAVTLALTTLNHLIAHSDYVIIFLFHVASHEILDFLIKEDPFSEELVVVSFAEVG